MVTQTAVLSATMAVSTWVPQGTCHRQCHTGFDTSWHRLTRLKRLYAVSLVFLWRSGLFSVTALGEQTWHPALNQQTCARHIVTTCNRLSWTSALFFRTETHCVWSWSWQGKTKSWASSRTDLTWDETDREIPKPALKALGSDQNALH